LKEWTERAKTSGITESKTFAVKLLQDTEAMVAAMILPYSRGQTEGRVNKPKLVKRSMYGRGKFDLLSSVCCTLRRVECHPATRREPVLDSSDPRKNRFRGLIRVE
jgi:transposase